MSTAKGRQNIREMVITALLVALIFLLGLTPLGLIPLGFINVTILCVPVVIGTLYVGWKKGLILGFSFGAASFISALMKPSALVSGLMAASPFWVVLLCFIPRLCIPLVAWYVYSWMNSRKENKAQRDAMRIFGTLAGALMGLFLLIVLFVSRAIGFPTGSEKQAYEFSRNETLLLMGTIVLFSALTGLVVSMVVSGKGLQKIIEKQAPAAVAAVCGSLTNTVLYLGMMLLFYVICGIDTAPVLALIGGTALIAGLSEATVAAVLVPPIFSAVKKVRAK